MKYSGSNRTNRFFEVFVFLWLLVLVLYVTQQRSFPYNFDDEYGVLGSAAVLAGYDWSTPANMPFYGFLLAIFSFPLFWLDLEPTVLYRSILAVNAVFVATSAVLALRTIRLLSEAYSELWRILAVIAGFSYPAVIHYSALALGETALLFCFFFTAYHLTVLLHSSETRVFNAILLGLGIGAAQYAHPRGVAFVIAAIVVILYALRARSILFKQFGIITLSALLSIVALASVKSHLLTVFNTHGHVSSSLLSFVDSRFSLLSFDRLIPFLQVIFGQLTYLLTSTFGLLLPAVAILTSITWMNFKNCEMNLKSNPDNSVARSRGLLSGFVLLSFSIMFAASVIQMAGAVRGDHFFYGRYNEVMVPALLIASIVFLSHMSKKMVLRWTMAGCLIAVLSAIVIGWYPEDIFQRKTHFSTITSWFVHSHGLWEINPRFILFGTAAAVFVLAGSVLFSRRLFVTVLITFFTSTALYNFETQHKMGDREWNEFNELAAELGDKMAGLQLQVRGSELNSRIKGEALQIAFPKSHVNFENDILNDVDAVLDYQGGYCHENTTIAYMRNASFCVVNDEIYEQFEGLAVPLDINPVRSRAELAPAIEINEGLKTTGIRMGKVDRVLALIAKEYFTGWFRYCLPSVTAAISQSGASGNENNELGVFITDLSGKWLEQWRVPLDFHQRRSDGSMRATSSVYAQSTVPPGKYWLNIALIDEQGWDWRGSRKIPFTVEQ
ncbi:MAG: hypothetical protein K9K37_01235 [Desulfocapsa sp.]|nr:hypothetical protein [Desulfocapsa sp.]